MSCWTKRQRHAIYKQAIRAMQEGKMTTGLCRLFAEHTSAKYTVFRGSLTEFNACKPYNVRPGNRLWWPRTKDGNITREMCLYYCHDKTKPTPRTKKKTT